MARTITPVIDYQNSIPQAVWDKIKPLDKKVSLLWAEKSNVTVLEGFEGAWTRSPTQTIGKQTILPEWSFVDPSSKTQVFAGFFDGYDSQMEPKFNPPTFVGGRLELIPENSTHEKWWKMIQIHPHYRENVAYKPSLVRFYLDDKEKAEEDELSRMKLVNKAKIGIETLSPEQLRLVINNLGAQTELGLHKFAEKDPSTVLASIDQLSVISVRDFVDKVFQPPYSLLVFDANTNTVLWSEGRKEFFAAGTATDAREALTFYLMGRTNDGTKESATSKDQKAKYKTLVKRVEEIDADLEKAKAAKALLGKESSTETNLSVTV